jgi:hypothetical protein
MRTMVYAASLRSATPRWPAIRLFPYVQPKGKQEPLRCSDCASNHGDSELSILRKICQEKWMRDSRQVFAVYLERHGYFPLKSHSYRKIDHGSRTNG